MSKKLTYNFVKESFEKEGYTLLSKEYVNSKTKLDYICPKGHEHSIMYYNWKSGQRCPCNTGFNNIKLTHEFVMNEFKKEGYTLLSKKYKNNKQKLKYKCPHGNYGTIRWDFWQRGDRCNCLYVPKWTIEKVRSLFKDKNCVLLSNKYKNVHNKLDYICPNGNRHSITLHDFQQGNKCPCRKCQSERWRILSIKMLGKDNHQWIDGRSSDSYCDAWKDKEYKQDIRNRDGNKCLNPYCDSPDNTDLTIHHIDYDKKNCQPKNLITVCRSCNSRANSDRDWHTPWYQAILNRRFGYEYRKI